MNKKALRYCIANHAPAVIAQICLITVFWATNKWLSLAWFVVLLLNIPSIYHQYQYEKIHEAYLKTIDEYKKMADPIIDALLAEAKIKSTSL